MPHAPNVIMYVISGDSYLSLAAALLLASLRLRDCRWASAQILHRDSPGIAGLLHFWHLPSSLALCLWFLSVAPPVLPALRGPVPGLFL